MGREEPMAHIHNSRPRQNIKTGIVSEAYNVLSTPQALIATVLLMWLFWQVTLVFLGALALAVGVVSIKRRLRR